MTLQLTSREIGEYAKLKTKFFGKGLFFIVSQDLEFDPDYHRYCVLNKKLLKMARFYFRLKKAEAPIYQRVQQIVVRHTYGKCITGFSPAVGLILE